MKVDSYKCDVCRRLKGDTNHWFRFRSMISAKDATERFVVGKRGSPTFPDKLHLCSDQYVVTTMQEWLTEQAKAVQQHKRG